MKYFKQYVIDGSKMYFSALCVLIGAQLVVAEPGFPPWQSVLAESILLTTTVDCLPEGRPRLNGTWILSLVFSSYFIDEKTEAQRLQGSLSKCPRPAFISGKCET